jgi:hypothetical protein
MPAVAGGIQGAIASSLRFTRLGGADGRGAETRDKEGLNPAKHPAEFRELVAEAVRIARAHPDEYIRHRVEHQVR